MSGQSSADDARAGRVPVHLWIVGVLGLAWNGFGAYDYYKTKTGGDAYMAAVGMPPEQIVYMHAMPVWMTAVWAIGVWGAVLGTVLLLLRNKLAVPVFLASLIGFLVSLVYGYLVAPMPQGNSAGMLAMQGIILAGCLFFLWYATMARRNGWLS
jgi:hypothetical protein